MPRLWYWHSELTAARPGASVIWSIEDALAAKAKSRHGGARAASQDSTDEYEAAIRATCFRCWRR